MDAGDREDETSETAALKIQTIARGRRDRQIVQKKREDMARQEREAAALKLQTLQRGRRDRRRFGENREHEGAALRIQAAHRGRRGRRVVFETSHARLLRESDVRDGLSCVGRVADSLRHAYLHCSVRGLGVGDISVLPQFPTLQLLDISHNEIEDLSPLQDLPYLTELYASNNKVDRLLRFMAPHCSNEHPDEDGDTMIGSLLQRVDLSHNVITEMENLSKHPFLEELNLGFNRIEAIQGLEQLHYLHTLDLSKNELTEIRGLDNLPLEELYLDKNKIRELENLETLHNLRILSVRSNQITQLQHLKLVDSIISVDVTGNSISSIRQLEHLLDLQFLRHASFAENPISGLDWYRHRVLVRLQRLATLDEAAVTAEEKIRAVNFHGGREQAIPQLKDINYENDSDLGHRAVTHEKSFPGVEFINFLPPFEESEPRLQE